ncbi:MAG: 30S ribosomal protein S28e [Candidatus Micrarchaeum sp. ARMAN-1]|jgi:small subunit ribosomal protein S28e|nr:MAG: 30S ribosomal protein S28e [Candidatus Micrarchaeum sp. ARMAN-1]
MEDKPAPHTPAQSAPSAPSKPTPQFSGFLAEVVEINNKVKTGMYGEVYQVTCRILEGKDKGRIIRRNEIGPIKKGDVIRLPDTSREAREIKVK